MALRLATRYPGRANAPSTDYPQGSFKNRSAPGVLDGTPLEKDWANDKEGFFQSLLKAAGIIANDVEDKVGASQYFNALKSISNIPVWSNLIDYTLPALVFGSDNNIYVALQISGPSTAPRDPISQPTYWKSLAAFLGIDTARDIGKVAYFGQSSAPTNYLKANGAAVSRTTYAALFAEYGITYGPGDGSTTFNLPDLRGEFVRGWDDSRGVDSGRVIGSSQKGTLHNFDAGATNAVVSDRTASTGVGGVGQSDLGLDYQNSLTSFPNALYSSVAGSATGAPLNNAEQGYGIMRPRNVALLACVKYQ